MNDEKTKIERAWKVGKAKALEEWKEITPDRARRELAEAHGGMDGDLSTQQSTALTKLQKEGALETQYGSYRIS